MDKHPPFAKSAKGGSLARSKTKALTSKELSYIYPTDQDAGLKPGATKSASNARAGQLARATSAVLFSKLSPRFRRGAARCARCECLAKLGGSSSVAER